MYEQLIQVHDDNSTPYVYIIDNTPYVYNDYNTPYVSTILSYCIHCNVCVMYGTMWYLFHNMVFHNLLQIYMI
jgi:hypothetical protein